MARFSRLLSRRWLQFRLRTLLLSTVVVAIACCWLTPFTREERWPDGTLQARYRLRRQWSGAVVATGEQWEFYDTGQPERRWVQHSGPPGGECDGTNCTHWSADGERETPGRDLFGHLIWLITHTITPESWTTVTAEDWDEVILLRHRYVQPDLGEDATELSDSPQPSHADGVELQ
jgi:hypothetical protein